ncbi:MAG: uncharacterized protein QOE65_390 [Solirubrobacteraceae bacterium]|jgi:uncharacterized membrane protein YraQ (UPF0718 family)|nr:uncharacterized protein [Solirubrobacteraceae bacterium]
MATQTAAPVPSPPRRVPLWAAGAALWTTVAAVLAARAGGLAQVDGLATFCVIFTSIMVEAIPFVLIGALVSAAVAVYVPDRAFARLSRLPPALQVPGAAAAGLAFPVCECGSVPVARRLLLRGLHPAAGVTFMLAAPIVNPIVVASTWVAYGGGTQGTRMVAGRCGLGLLASVVAGWRLGPHARVSSRPEDTSHEHPAERRGSFVTHLAGDFLYMARFLALGAALSALLQTVVPQTILSGLAGSLVLGTLALMGLAFILSLCSEADAFVATSFTAFPLGAQLGFLVLGPLADVKLAAMYEGTFRRGFVVRLLALAVPLVLAGSVAYATVAW